VYIICTEKLLWTSAENIGIKKKKSKFERSDACTIRDASEFIPSVERLGLIAEWKEAERE
jgi:hypothetical protein